MECPSCEKEVITDSKPTSRLGDIVLCPGCGKEYRVEFDYGNDYDMRAWLNKA